MCHEKWEKVFDNDARVQSSDSWLLPGEKKREPLSLLGDVRCWPYGFAYVPLLGSLPENQDKTSILVVYNLEQSRKEAISTRAAREGPKQ